MHSSHPPLSPPLRRSVLLAASLLTCISLAAGLASSAWAGESRAARGTCTDPGPLDGVCDYLMDRKGVVQVALFDQKTGRFAQLSEGDAPQYTASIVKVDILAHWLRRFQKGDVNIPNGIPYSIRYLMQRMIQNSDSAAATSLFYFGGGCDALTRFNARIPMNDTDVACETPNYYGWATRRPRLLTRSG